MAQENQSSQNNNEHENEEEEEEDIDLTEEQTEGKENKENIMHNDINEGSGTVKLILYDFDQTITCLHLYRELHGGQLNALSKLSNKSLINIYGGQERINILNNHFKYLTDNNIEIGIVSFGYTNVIQKALQRVNLDSYFKNKIIIGRDSKEIIYFNKNKGKVINTLMEKRNLKCDQVLFVDDALSNCQQSQSYCRTLHISARNGITMDDIKYIQQSIYVYTKDELQQILLEKKETHKEEQNGYSLEQEHKKKKSWKDKYKLDNVPKWFDDLNKKEDETPIIEINHESFPEFSNGFNINGNNNNNNLNQDHEDVQIATKFTFGDD